MKSCDQQTEFNTINHVIPLPDLFEFFQFPHHARIVSGLDVLSRPEYGLAPDTVFTFSRPIPTKIALSWLPQDGSGSKHSVQVPVDSSIEFICLPFDPVTGECNQLVYKTAADLARGFPPFARVQSLSNCNQAEVGGVKPGDVIKLLRLVYTSVDDKSIECRNINDTSVINLPFNCVGEFVAIFDPDVTYTLSDLVCGHVMPVRRRRIQPTSRDLSIIPPGVSSLFVELVESNSRVVEARPLYDPVTLIRLPDYNDTILVAPVPDSPGGSGKQSLARLVEQCQGMFPLVVSVTDWKEETAILENHFLRPGVDLILHGTTRLDKVLACAGGRYYSVPMTYRGLFRRRPRLFAGGRQLFEQVTPSSGLIVRVVYISRNEQLNVQLGDRLRITPSDSLGHYITCEKLDASSPRVKVKELVKIPVSSTASFEEVLINESDLPRGVDELTEIMLTTDCQLRVVLLEASDDKSRSNCDLPLNADIMFIKVFQDLSVYASVDSPDNPVFHIPLRTSLDVCFHSQLDRRDSPLLDPARRRASSPPTVSTLDRCAELLSASTVSFLRQQSALNPSSSRDGSNEMTQYEYEVINSAPGHEVRRSEAKMNEMTSNNKNNTSTGRDRTMSLAATDDTTSVQQSSTSVVTFPSADADNDDIDDVTVMVSAKAGNFKLRIPDDGNLYQLSSKRFIELLQCLSVDHQVIEACRRRRIDGRLFSRLTEREMELSGLMNPVLLHFRRLTVKQTQPRR